MSDFRNILASIGHRIPNSGLLWPRGAAVLVYHGVSRRPDAQGLCAASFEKQMELLARTFRVVPAGQEGDGSSQGPMRVSLTFDDGLRNNAEVVAPILRKYEFAALFFVCHRNTAAQKPLWFTYLKMLERYFPGRELMVAGLSLDMSSEHRRASVRKLERMLLDARPHPSTMYELIDNELPLLESFIDESTLIDEAYGMTVEQVADIARDSLFTVGAHTMDHPLLPLCSEEEMQRQVDDNKQWLEEVCGGPVDTIAYPGGEYTPAVVEHCRNRGFQRGYAVDQTFNLNPELEIERSGVYYPSPAEPGLKIRFRKASAALARVRRLAFT